MKDKGEDSERIEVGRPQYFGLPQHQPDSMLPQFLASFTKESPHFQTSKRFENEFQKSRDQTPLPSSTAPNKLKDIGEFSSDLPHPVTSTTITPCTLETKTILVDPEASDGQGKKPSPFPKFDQKWASFFVIASLKAPLRDKVSRFQEMLNNQLDRPQIHRVFYPE